LSLARLPAFLETGIERTARLAVAERTRLAPLGRSLATARLARRTAFGRTGTEGARRVAVAK
jgi:hypothetical protein